MTTGEQDECSHGMIMVYPSSDPRYPGYAVCGVCNVRLVDATGLERENRQMRAGLEDIAEVSAKEQGSSVAQRYATVKSLGDKAEALIDALAPKETTT